MTEDHFSQRKFQTQNSSLNQLHDQRTRNEVKSEVYNMDVLEIQTHLRS